VNRSLNVRRSAALLVALLLALSPLVPATPGAAQAAPGGALGKHDRHLLASAIARGDTTVTLLIAARPGANRTVAAGLAGLGATVRYRDDDLDYIRAIVPVDRALRAAQLPGVQAASLDELIPREDPRPDATDEPAVVPPPGADTPPQNPYLPTRDIGAPQFVAANPTFDGRGVKIGILDTGIDLLAPELQNAKTLDGRPARKIVDWVNANDPLSGLDPSWVSMEMQVTVTGGQFTAGGVAYSGVPADGVYRFGLFREASIGTASEYSLGTPCGGNRPDVNRNGICDEVFAVLWRTSDNTVWVDTNADRSFAGELAMTDYRVKYDVGLFGTDNPATAVRETVPFVVQTDGKNKFVNIGIVDSAHGTHVAGIAAGNGFFGGAFHGAAPEAQIVSVRVCLFTGFCSAAGLIEGMIYAAKQANVDVISMSIGGLPALNDGNNARALLYNRLSDLSKVQMFFSAGNNGPGLNTVGDPSVATRVLSVGAYVHKDTWLHDYGAVAAKDDGLFPFSSRGPREDGGLKPNIVAPGAAISTIPAWQPPCTFLPHAPATLPPGYCLFQGTSMAAPQAAGGAALLISAAKQREVQWKPDQLRQAITSSARYLPAYGAHEQGSGLVQVGAAWDLLKTNLKPVEITSSAPVNTVLSGLLQPPNVGPGIYEREGWTAGRSETRTITFTRTSGGGRPIAYSVQWVGNDGTFSSAGSISLPLNTAVPLAVTVRPLTPGVHSARLVLDDPATPGIDYQVLNTVVAAEPLNAGNGFSVTAAGQADRPDRATFFFVVPAGMAALKLDLTVQSGRVRLLPYDPQGLPRTATGFCTAPCTLSQTLSQPMAGVWEAAVEVSRASPATPATFGLQAVVLGVDVVPPSWTVDPTTIGTAYTQSFTFTNRAATFTGNAVGTALGSAFKARPTIAATGPEHVFSINVPAGSTAISARIGKPSDPGADLDLYLYDCTDAARGCVLKSASESPISEEFVSATNPAAGLWKVIVVPFAVPAGSTAYDYLDSFANPMFGAVAVSDPPALRPTGSTWMATAVAMANAAPAAGRFLQGFVQAKSGATVLGTAEVNLLNVGP
jgi:hypothetical protein